MPEVTKMRRENPKPYERRKKKSLTKGGLRLLVLSTSILFIFLWTVNAEMLGAIGDAPLAAARWAVMLPAFTIGFLAGSRSRPGVLVQAIFVSSLMPLIILAPHPYPSFLIWIRILSAFCVARGAALLNDDERAALSTAIVGSLAVMVCVSALAGYLKVPVAYVGGEFFSGEARIRLRGITDHPGVLGIYSAISLVFALITVIDRNRNATTRFLWAIVVMASLYSLVMSDSRTGQIGAVASLAIISCRGFFAIIFKNKSARAAAAAIFAISALGLLSVPILIATHFLNFGGSGTVYSNSNAMRQAIWSYGLKVFSQHPWVGTGLGSTFNVRASLTLGENGLLYYHSLLVNYLAKTGIFGAVSVALLILVTLHLVFSKMVDRTLYQEGARSAKLAIRFACVTSITIVVSSTFEGTLQGVYPSFLLFFLAAAILPRQLRAKYNVNS